jgi:hypothetical protein
MVRFTKPHDGRAKDRNGSSGKSESFDLLGFDYWGRSLRGRWVVKRKTSTSQPSRG